MTSDTGEARSRLRFALFLILNSDSFSSLNFVSCCPSALNALQYHAWPGNVRELRNVIERAVIICSGEQIERHHFAPYPIEQRERLRNEDTLTLPVGTPLEEVERQMIMRTLQKTKNNKTRAAELLGISLKTLHNKLNLYRERGLIHEE